MNLTVRKLLGGATENHILPFFWQHGEDEVTIRKMMDVIHGAGCGAVCVESRPHPDFCGGKWWQDMDVILDEARKQDMKVWILDDSHFPTGFANDGLKNKPDELCRQNIFLAEKRFKGKARLLKLDLRRQKLMTQPKMDRGIFGKFAGLAPQPRKYNDDRILCITADQNGNVIDITNCLSGTKLLWMKPEGEWTLRVVTASRNTGSHRNYINMTDAESCRILIDSVYEPHWQHYAADFGKTIAGFFSDEPELGNGALYMKNNYLGTEQDLPWGRAMEKEVQQVLGEHWRMKLQYLWRDGENAAQVRCSYMDVLTKLVRSSFSKQISDWCHAHGVQYIGHVIEDDGQHCRTGSSLGHYFRGLQYQDMAGIDDIGGQVYPQGEEEPRFNNLKQPRNGEFYHYALAKLAQSAAAIEHRKNGNAMCEIFGNYGWQEGVRLEKYLADHFLVRGINYYVPHAFSGKPFPDPDCPPHFYAQGHNPQYRHFTKLMEYMNRAATLISSGPHEVPVAILYHGENEWADSSAMPFEKPLRELYDHQIDCHTVPADIFSEPEHYRVELGNPLCVNRQKYGVFIVPACSRLPRSAAKGIKQLVELGLPVFFVDRRPEAIAETGERLEFGSAPCVPLKELYTAVAKLNLNVPRLDPANDRIRLLHIHGDTDLIMMVNEGIHTYKGRIHLPVGGACYWYDPWLNTCHRAECDKNGVNAVIEPLKSMFLVFGEVSGLQEKPECRGTPTVLNKWTRSICEATKYPIFGEEKAVVLPDTLAEEQPRFSGYVRYRTQIEHASGDLWLEITDASEGVEVFLNGKSLGIQIAPPFRYRLTEHLLPKSNDLVIEVATTLERQAYPLLTGYQRFLAPKPQCQSGITGVVQLLHCMDD